MSEIQELRDEVVALTDRVDLLLQVLGRVEEVLGITAFEDVAFVDTERRP